MNPDLPQEPMWRDDSKPGAKGDVFVEVFHVRRHQPIRLRLDGRHQHRYVVAMTYQVAMGVELLFGDSVEPLQGDQFQRQGVVVYQSGSPFVIDVEPA